jgi:cytochrome P450
MPFGTGSYNCAGQQLAMMELRSVTANLINLFHVEFAHEENGKDLLERSRVCFTTNIGKLDVRLKPRYNA